MNLEEYEKLKSEESGRNFYNNYKGFAKMSNIISFVSQLFSILFAYFFINNLILSSFVESSPTLEYISMGVSIIILCSVELLKRNIFMRFTDVFIKEKVKFKETETKILAFVSILLISGSFYFSINGAHVYIDNKDKLKDKAESNVSVYSDSLSKKYEAKILYYENQNKILFEANQKYDSKMDGLNTKLSSDISLREQKNISKEINQIRKDKESNNNLINQNDGKIKEIKTEKDAEISKYESKLNDKTKKKIEDTSSNPFIFFIFSTVIEFLILVGIYFINFFRIKSINDFENTIGKDPKYKAYNIWLKFVDSIYKNDNTIGSILPFKTELLKGIKANNIDLAPKELDDMIRIFTNLGILKKKGNRNVISTNKEDTALLIKEHFGIS